MTRAQRRREERKMKKLGLEGWTISEEPIKNEEHFTTTLARWLSVEGASICYDDCGVIYAVFHPSCESNPKPHFHMIVISEDKKQRE